MQRKIRVGMLFSSAIGLAIIAYLNFNKQPITKESKPTSLNRTISSITPLPVVQNLSAVAKDPKKINKNLNADLVEKNVTLMLEYMKNGPAKISREDFKASTLLLGKYPVESLENLKKLIDESKPSESELRSNLYAAIAQVVSEAKIQKSADLPKFIENYKEMVYTELKRDALAENHDFDNYSDEWKKELTHLRPYKIVKGQLYSVNLPAQLAAMYALGLCQDSLATEELKQISLSSEFEDNIRSHAALLLESKLFSL